MSLAHATSGNALRELQNSPRAMADSIHALFCTLTLVISSLSPKSQVLNRYVPIWVPPRSREEQPKLSGTTVSYIPLLPLFNTAK